MTPDYKADHPLSEQYKRKTTLYLRIAVVLLMVAGMLLCSILLQLAMQYMGLIQ